MMIKKFFTTILFSSSVLLIQAQEAAGQKSVMADLMRNNGKIYVVIAVMLTILTGLIGYMIRLDRKISKLEKEDIELIG